MPQMDLTFIHAPATYDFRERSIMYGPVSDMVPSTPIFEMYPLGLVTIGEYLERHDMHVRIFNLAGKMLNVKGFDVERELGAMDTVAFGIDLHWMPHCHGSIEVAKVLKSLHPDKPIIFGGLSSSIFHKDLAAYSCIDYVVRGDSTEEIMLRLMRRIKQAQALRVPIGDLSDIPNLTWKDEAGCVHENPLTWVTDDIDSISLDYSYPMKAVIRHHDMLSYEPTKGWLAYPVTAALSCHGCNRNCATCGGSNYAFRNHFGRQSVAWRSPQLMIDDIANAQKHIWGPIFVLNDFLQAGTEYTHSFVEGLRGKLKNPIGFEFFGPPEEGDDFYRLLDDNIDDWSVEISAESHDDAVRAAFGKGHYKMTELEETIKQALSHEHCSRFDLYFMTGIPHQTAASVRETGEYVQHLYDLVDHDPRLLVFSSPMAPFLDVGSIAFDNPEKYGYKLRAHTLEEHRARMVLPSWKHIMNYESTYMTTDEMVDATYDAALDINRIKGACGIIDAGKAGATDARIRQAREQMDRLDTVLEQSGRPIEETMAKMREEFGALDENTVANKADLNWPHAMRPSHVGHLAALGATELGRNAIAGIHGTWSKAASTYPYGEQECGTVAPVYVSHDGVVEENTAHRDVHARRGSVEAPGFEVEEPGK